MKNKAVALLLRYGLSQLVVALIVYAMVAEVPDTPAQFYPFLLGAILCIALLAGRGPGYAAVTVGALAVALYALRGAGFAVSDPDDASGLIGVIATGVLSVAFVGTMRDRLLVTSATTRRLTDENAGLRAMVSEFSHRLRNDLGGLVATAHLQSPAAVPPETRDALNAMAERINALGSVYARLDTGRMPDSSIEVKPFIEGLCGDLRLAHLSVRPVVLSVDVMEVSVPAGRAVLIGLVLNELLTNAFKYAFPDDREGMIKVSLLDHPVRAGIWQLKVTDDGVGFGDTGAKGSGLGQRLMKARASQLDGMFSLARLDGLTVGLLDFPA